MGREGVVAGVVSLMKSMVPPSQENRVYCTINPRKAKDLSGFELLSTRACFRGAWPGGSLAPGPAGAASPSSPRHEPHPGVVVFIFESLSLQPSPVPRRSSPPSLCLFSPFVLTEEPPAPPGCRLWVLGGAFLPEPPPGPRSGVGLGGGIPVAAAAVVLRIGEVKRTLSL